MRVAIITESFPPDVNGVAHCVLRVAELLARYGHHPLVIAPQPPREDKGDTFPFPVVRVPAAPLPGYPSFRLGLPSHRVRDALVEHRTEVVHLASPVCLGAHGAAVAGRLGLGYVGRLATEKRVEWLAGITALEGVRLVIVGGGPAEAMLRQHMPSAVFVGERRGDELAAIYASLDVFAHSGPYETFGQTLQEAAASGLPVVAPAAGGPLDLVEDGVTGYLVPPADPDALTCAVARLAADPARRAAFGAAGRRKVLGRSWPALTEELLGHCAAVLGRAERAKVAT
jgi:hypothetical protein